MTWHDLYIPANFETASVPCPRVQHAAPTRTKGVFIIRCGALRHGMVLVITSPVPAGRAYRRS
jgi:hypothetical protein